MKFGRQRVRLFGIDAPEKLQPCDDGKWYPGPLATKALVDFIAGRPVSCHQVDYDWKNSRRRRETGGSARGRRSRPSLPATLGLADSPVKARR